MCCSWAGPQGLWGGTVDPGGRWEQTRDGAGSSREVPGCCWRSSRLSTQQVRCAWGILRCFVLGLNPYLPKSLSWARLRLIPRVVCPLPAALFQTDMQARFWGQLEGFRSPSPHTRSWFPHLPAPSSPNPHCPFFSPSPGVGRAAGQGGGGVGRAVRVGARPPPADEVRGAEPLHPLGQVRAPPGSPRELAPSTWCCGGGWIFLPLAWGAVVPAAGRPAHTAGSLCRYRSVVDMVRSWHREQQHFSFPHPRECNPRCPSKCSGSVCSHYTQVRAPPSPRLTQNGGGWICAGGDGAPEGARRGPCTHISASSSSGTGSLLLFGLSHKARSRSFFPHSALTFSLLPP